MIDNKGFALQFHWLFILIAGGIILVFFFSVAGKQKALSDEKLSLSLVQSMDAIFEMAGAGEGTSQVIPLPKNGLGFSCTGTCDCFVQSGSARKSFGNNIIFSEDEVKAPEVIVWSLPWKVPFRVVNLIFVSDPETRKIFVFDDSPFAKDLKDKLAEIIPDNIIFEQMSFAEFNSVSFDGSDLTKVFFVGNSRPFIPSAFQGKNIELLSINPQVLAFYDVQGSSLVPYDFIKYPADITWILAAMFSADKNMFVCGLKSALQRLNLVAKVFSDRAMFLAEKTDEMGLECAYPVDELDDLITENVVGLSDDDLFSSISRINSVRDSLVVRNDQLIERSCPELF